MSESAIEGATDPRGLPAMSYAELSALAAKNGQFRELVRLQADYNLDVKRIKLLVKTVSENGTELVDFHARLGAYTASQRHRLKIAVQGSVASSVERFVENLSRVCDDVHRKTDGVLSAHDSCSGILEHKLIEETKEFLSWAYVEAAFVPAERRRAVRAHALEQLEALWAETVGLLIAGERRAAAADAEGCRRLAQLVLQLEQMRTNRRPAAAILEHARRMGGRCRHAAVRVAADVWYAASVDGICEALDSMSEPDENAATLLEAWLVDHGAAAHVDLVADSDRLEAIAVTPIDSPLWHSIELVASIADPGSAEAVLFLGCAEQFTTTTGRLYARPVPTTDTRRVVSLACSFHALHAVVREDWIPLGRFSARFAVQVLERECGVIENRRSEIASQLLHMARDAGVAAEPRHIVTFLLPLSSSGGGDVEAFDAPAVSPERPTTFDVSVVDILRVPRSRRRVVPFRPRAVPSSVLLQYLVVHGVYSLVNDAVTLARDSLSSVLRMADVRFECSCIVEATARAAGRLNATREWLDTHLRSPAMMRQLVCSTCHKLCAEVTKANALARESGAGAKTEWRVKFGHTRLKSENRLFVSSGGLEDSCLVFLEWCARLLAYLDASWPLPAGSHWSV